MFFLEEKRKTIKFCKILHIAYFKFEPIEFSWLNLQLKLNNLKENKTFKYGHEHGKNI